MTGSPDVPYDVLPIHDGSGGLALLEYGGVRQSGEPGRVVVYFDVRIMPKAERSRVGVWIDSADYEEIRQKLKLLRRELHDGLEEIATVAIGADLDSRGMPDFTPSGKPAYRVPSEDVISRYWDKQRLTNAVSDEEILQYAARKIYWGWRHGMTEMSFSMPDAHRLKVPLAELDRVAIAGEGKYWTRNGAETVRYMPSGRLIQDFSTGVAPGAFRPPIIASMAELNAPRYRSVHSHLQKAVEYSNGPNEDLPNAIKEATAAVESLALIVVGRQSGTLGDCIKDLRSRGAIAPALLKAVESLWAYASEEPGVRHGKPQWSAPVEAEASFAIGLAANAIALLLQIDA